MTLRHEFECDGAADVNVAIESGQVSVRVGAHDRVMVEIDGKPDDWEVVQVGPSVSVRPMRRRRTPSVRIEVLVPERSRFAVVSTSGDVRADGPLGSVRAKTTSGNVSVGDVEAFEMSSTSGDVRTGDIEGDVQIATVSGDVRAGNIGGRLTVTTTSGDVDVRSIGGDVLANTVAGDVRIDRFDGDDLAVKSVSGDLVLGLPRGIRVVPSISTFAGDTRLPESRSAAEPSSDRRRVAVAFKSVSGDITISRIDV